MTNIKDRLEKALNGDHEAAEYYAQTIQRYPKNTWVAPTNGTGEGSDFTIFFFCASNHLCAKKIVPIWRNGSFCGNNIFFMYNDEFNFSVT